MSFSFDYFGAPAFFSSIGAASSSFFRLSRNSSSPLLSSAKPFLLDGVDAKRYGQTGRTVRPPNSLHEYDKPERSRGSELSKLCPPKLGLLTGGGADPHAGQLFPARSLFRTTRSVVG